MAYPAKIKKAKKNREKSEIGEATNAAFCFLSYRAHSVEEVRRKLAEKGFSPLTITRTVDRIKELGYLNDGEYAYNFACSSLVHKQWGTLRIQDALINKGVSQEIVNHTVAKIKGEYDLVKIAGRALETKFTQFRSHQPLDKKTTKRAIDFLRRQGFCWSTISSIIKSEDDA